MQEELLSLRYRGDCLDRSGAPLPDDAAVALRLKAKANSLTNGVRITHDLFPAIAALLDEVGERLGLTCAPEGYVYNSPESQANSLGFSGGTMMMTLSSGLVQLLSSSELMFVLGHEIGHCIYEHSRYPAADDSENEIEELNCKALRRASEISADRVGFVACRSKKDAFRAIIKTASGLPDRFLRCETAAYLDQARELRDLGGSETELLSTHPMFLVRMRALLLFEMSDPYYSWTNKTGGAPLTRDALADRVDQALSAATGFRLAHVNEEAVRKALLWGFLQLFVADNTLSKSEQALLARAVGADIAHKAVEYARHFGPEGVQTRFSATLSNAKGLPLSTQNALYEDLQHYAAHAGGSIAQREAVLREANDVLGLGRIVEIPSKKDAELLQAHALTSHQRGRQ